MAKDLLHLDYTPIIKFVNTFLQTNGKSCARKRCICVPKLCKLVRAYKLLI